MKIRVYLDDERKTPDGWHRAYSVEDAIAFLKTGLVEEISLDHDLAPEHYAGQLDSRTGYAVVLWLEQRVMEDENFVLPIVRIHSMNPVGREHMERGLRRIERFMRERGKH